MIDSVIKYIATLYWTVFGMDPNLWNVQNVLFDVSNFQKQDQLPEAKNQAVKTFKFTLTTEMKSNRDVV